MKTMLYIILGLSLSALILNDSKTELNDAVIEFMESLDNEQLEKVSYRFDDQSRESWHFLPPASWSRSGLQLKALTKSQKEKLFSMLSGFLSAAGYQKTKEIMELENVLAEIEDNPEYRDAGRYHVAVYGLPQKDSLWAWSFEGHHISLNFTILNNELVASPRFFGANPAKILEGPRKGDRTLDREEDLAFELIDQLSVQQRTKAIFSSKAFPDIVTGNASEVTPLDQVGIATRDLSATQQTLLKKLISEYLSSLPEELAIRRQEKIMQEEFDEIRFGWAGKTEKGSGHYYRIQGKTFLIEFDNTQNNANHIHTVWRDFDGDFGRDLIQEHYRHSEHHRH